jgi:hypothetical protein
MIHQFIHKKGILAFEKAEKRFLVIMIRMKIQLTKSFSFNANMFDFNKKRQVLPVFLLFMV